MSRSEKQKRSSEHSQGDAGLEDEAKAPSWRAKLARVVVIPSVDVVLTNFRLLLPPVLATLIVSSLAAATPTSEWEGNDCFLSITAIFLFFFPGDNTIGRQIESALLGLIGAAIGVGVSTLAVAGAVWVGDGEYAHPKGRAIGICVLTAMSFIGGYLSSKTPRLTIPVRLMIFDSVWVLCAGETKTTVRTFTTLFYPTLIAAMTGLFVNLVCFPRSAMHVLASSVVDTLETTMAVVERSVDEFFAEAKRYKDESNRNDLSSISSHSNEDDPNLPAASMELHKLQTTLFERTTRLPVAFRQAEFEMAYSHVPVGKLRPLIRPIKQIRVWVACGMGLGAGPSIESAQMVAAAGRRRQLPKAHAHTHAHTATHSTQADAKVPPATARSVSFSEVDLTHPRARPPLGSRAASYTGARTLATTPHPRSVPHARLQVEQFETVTRSLAEVVVASLALVRMSVCFAFHLKAGWTKIAVQGGVPEKAIAGQRKLLDRAIERFKGELQFALDALQQRDFVNVGAPSRPAPPVNTPRWATFQEQLSGLQIPQTWAEAHQHEEEISDEEEENGNQQAAFNLFRPKVFALSFLMISLIEIAMETANALRIAQELVRFRLAHRRQRLWWPRLLSKAWFTMASEDSAVYGEARRVEDVSEEVEGTHVSTSAEQHFDETEVRAVREALRTNKDDREDPFCHKRWTPTPARPTLLRSSSAHNNFGPSILDGSLTVDPLGKKRWHRWWYGPRIIDLRIKLSRIGRSAKHSRHLRFAFKLAVGMACLSLPCWLGGAARQWWVTERGEWMLITYMYCLETSTGATTRVSMFRIIGTILGAVYGLIVCEISRGNPYPLVVLVTLAALPSSWIILKTNFQGVGVVFSVTIAPVAYIPYHHLPYRSVPNLALVRAELISAGILAALLMNFFLFPYHARVQFINRIARVCTDIQQLYLSMTRQILRPGLVPARTTQAEFEGLENKIQTAILHADDLIDLMQMELSLLPKPLSIFRGMLARLQTVYDLLVGLRFIREHGLRSIRKETVIDVMDLRAELVSAVLITLFAIGNSLVSRTALPQFLPDPQVALDRFTSAIRQHMEENADESSSSAHPDAYYALHRVSELRREGIFYRRGSREEMGMAGTRVSSPVARSPRTPSTPARRLNYAYFFLLAEHMALKEMIGALNDVVEATRLLVGTATFISSEWIPRGLGSLHAHRSVITTTLSLTQAHALSLQSDLIQATTASSPLSTDGGRTEPPRPPPCSIEGTLQTGLPDGSAPRVSKANTLAQLFQPPDEKDEGGSDGPQ